MGNNSLQNIVEVVEIVKYRDCLWEIKKRIDVIKSHLNGRYFTEHLITDVELMCLQFRKIVELIALSSLVAHKKFYSEIHSDFANHNHVKKIFRKLEEINPDFYPNPVTKTQIDENKSTLQDIEAGFATKENLIEMYNVCSGLLHAENPYGEKVNIEELKSNFLTWVNKIIMLLGHHMIILADGNTALIALMQSESGNPQVYLFKKQST